jgi:diguanylate cyclase
MLRGFFINAAILISFVSISNLIFYKIGLSPRSPLKYRLLHGLICGLLGMVLIEFGVPIPPSGVMSFRNIAIIWAALYSGPVSAVIAGVMIAGYRLIRLALNWSSLTALLGTTLVVVASCLIARLRLRLWKRGLIAVLFHLIVNTIIFSGVIIDGRTLRTLLSFYWIGTALVAWLVYLYAERLETTSRQFRIFKEESARDHLTGLNNLREYELFLTAAAEEARANREPISLLYIDIDFFKSINDRFGHPAGDDVLKEIARIMKRICRRVDFISRNGGEEFTILLVNCPAFSALEVAERIRRTVAQHPFQTADGERLTVTLSIGVATYPDHVADPDQLAERADEALYAAKRGGRNRVVCAKRLSP